LDLVVDLCLLVGLSDHGPTYRVALVSSRTIELFSLNDLMKRRSDEHARVQQFACLRNRGVTNEPGPGCVVFGQAVRVGSRSEENAIHCPSGDQAGLKSPAG
jgi:hypothetical protein